MLSFFLSYLLLYKYGVLFCVIAVASFGIPLPATALLMATGAFVAQGYFDVYSIFAYGLLACVLGDMTGFLLSYYYGRDIFLRIGFKKLLHSSRFRTIESFFVTHSISSIFLSRFLATSLGPAINILAGLSKISPKKFLLYDILGEACYILLYMGLGYMFADQWEAILSIAEDATTMIVLSIILLAVLFLRFRKSNA